MIIDSAIGVATVLHRLALGVECIDVLTNRLVSGSVRVGRQATGGTRPRPLDPSWPCLDLDRAGPGRFKLSHRAPVEDTLVVRVDDPTRRHVPRRFTVHTWPVGLLEENPVLPYVPVRSRLLRSWMWPGSAYPLPRGTTAVRGRVVRGGRPVRWARLVATGPTNEVAGRAHGDDRGEFVLVVANPAQNPLRNFVPVAVSVFAQKASVAADPFDRCADLVVENVPRSSAPPTASDLDNAVVRGTAVPAAFAANANGPTHLTVPVGAELYMASDIVFDPQP